MIAMNFSAALDDLFKLGSVGELQNVVEQKYVTRVATQYTRCRTSQTTLF